MKTRFVIFFIVFLSTSCKTYTIAPESLREQFIQSGNTQKNVRINDALFYGSIEYKSNGIVNLEVIDKHGNKKIIQNAPSLEMRVTHKNGKKYHFYFDTVILENDSLKGGRSRYIHTNTKIPLDSILKIEIQDGGKNFHYKE